MTLFESRQQTQEWISCHAVHELLCSAKVTATAPLLVTIDNSIHSVATKKKSLAIWRN